MPSLVSDWGVIVPGRPPTPCEGRAQQYFRVGLEEQQMVKTFENGTTIQFGPMDMVDEVQAGQPFFEQIRHIDNTVKNVLLTRMRHEGDGTVNEKKFDAWRTRELPLFNQSMVQIDGQVYSQTPSKFACVSNTLSIYSHSYGQPKPGAAYPKDADTRYGVVTRADALEISAYHGHDRPKKPKGLKQARDNTRANEHQEYQRARRQVSGPNGPPLYSAGANTSYGQLDTNGLVNKIKKGRVQPTIGPRSDFSYIKLDDAAIGSDPSQHVITATHVPTRHLPETYIPTKDLPSNAIVERDGLSHAYHYTRFNAPAPDPIRQKVDGDIQVRAYGMLDASQPHRPLGPVLNNYGDQLYTNSGAQGFAQSSANAVPRPDNPFQSPGQEQHQQLNIIAEASMDLTRSRGGFPPGVRNKAVGYLSSCSPSPSEVTWRTAQVEASLREVDARLLGYYSKEAPPQADSAVGISGSGPVAYENIPAGVSAAQNNYGSPVQQNTGDVTDGQSRTGVYDYLSRQTPGDIASQIAQADTYGSRSQYDPRDMNGPLAHAGGMRQQGPNTKKLIQSASGSRLSSGFFQGSYILFQAGHEFAESSPATPYGRHPIQATSIPHYGHTVAQRRGIASSSPSPQGKGGRYISDA
ncbi:hypothetical protein B0O99DRAFT_681694 [Bisporella sp. PMI_857]|nr:hypothetical protein B0O99DRAFT_681694 [Bisporella sp. PMI_857]